MNRRPLRQDHGARVGALSSDAGAQLLISGAQDGCVFLRAGGDSVRSNPGLFLSPTSEPNPLPQSAPH